MNETWGGDNWFANWVLPDPKANWNRTTEGMGELIRSSGPIDKSIGGLKVVSGSIFLVTDFVPGEKIPKNLAEKAAATVGEIVSRGLAEFTAKRALKETERLRKAAVKRAWAQEKELVERTGEGTRRWSQKEKQELLKRGKVKGYEGHHVNSVKGHPEMAGDPDNIKFVEGRQKHLAEHGGKFLNPTEGQKVDRSKRVERARKVQDGKPD